MNKIYRVFRKLSEISGIGDFRGSGLRNGLSAFIPDDPRGEKPEDGCGGDHDHDRNDDPCFFHIDLLIKRTLGNTPPIMHFTF